MTGITEADGTVYIFKQNGKIVTTLSDLKTDFRSYDVEVGELWHGDVAGDDLLVFTDRTRGDVFTYDLKAQEQRYRAGFFKGPVDVSCIDTDDGRLYAVCEWEGNCISVINSKWKRQKKFGSKGRKDGELNRPQSVTVTPWGNLLVADFGNDRISEFSTKGTFLQHVLVKDDITGPVSISYSHPYLWVADDNKNLRCFMPYDL